MSMWFRRRAITYSVLSVGVSMTVIAVKESLPVEGAKPIRTIEYVVSMTMTHQRITNE